MDSANREDDQVHRKDGALVLHQAVSTALLRTNGGRVLYGWGYDWWTNAVLQCLNLCILSAILLGILYLFFGAFPLVFEVNHGFSISQTGLSFLGLFVGMLSGIAADPLWRKSYSRLVQQREAQGGEPGGSEPEFRLPPTIFGAFLVPVALFGKLLQAIGIRMLLMAMHAGFGWTTYPHVSKGSDNLAASDFLIPLACRCTG